MRSDLDPGLAVGADRRGSGAAANAARLAVVGAAALEDHRVPDLPALLRPCDLLVSNEMRVIPAPAKTRRARHASAA